MIAPAQRNPDWHSKFLEMLPTIREHARFAFRHLRPEAREEAVQEVVAYALVAFVRLVERGRMDLAYATPLARYGVAQMYDGRRVGNKLNIRDVLSRRCQQAKNVRVERLDRWDAHDGEWKEVLVEDGCATPADLAASRIDFPAWLDTLGERKRQIALTLARGESTGKVAREFNVSPARVSQLRQELAASWRVFHGEAPQGLVMVKSAG